MGQHRRLPVGRAVQVAARPVKIIRRQRHPVKPYNGDTVKQWCGDSQWRALRADFARFRKNGYAGYFTEAVWVIAVYRLRRIARAQKPRLLARLLDLPLAVVQKTLVLFTHINLHPDAVIGPGLFIAHHGSIQVHGRVTMGADCALHQVCTLGAGSRPGGPTIGDHVFIGAHTCVLGPVTVGDMAKIGAGAVVVKDVPAGATVVPAAARVIEKKGTDPVSVATPPAEAHDAA